MLHVFGTFTIWYLLDRPGFLLEWQYSGPLTDLSTYTLPSVRIRGSRLFLYPMYTFT